MRKSSSFVFAIIMPSVVCSVMAMRCLGQASVTYEKTPLQTIDGFGASNAFYVGGDTSGTNPPDIADFYSTFTSAQQSEVLNALYSQTAGAGLSILRMRIDPNIETASGTYQWSTANENANFAWSAIGLGVSNVWAEAWTPPGWMKSNGSNDDGGSLLYADYGAYASYLRAYYDQMVNVYGVPLSHIAIQNEPDQTQTYESCIWSGQDFYDFLSQSTLPAFPSNFFILPELSYWSDSYAGSTLANGATSELVGVVAAHAYNLAQNGSNYTPFTDAANDGKHVWETEVADLDTEVDDIADALAYAQNIHNSIVLGGVSAWHYWWAFEIYGIANQQTANGQSLILYDAANSTFEYKKTLYAIGNFARFVRPGFQQMSVSSNTPSSGVFLSAFANSSTGEVVLVAINTNTTTSAVAVSNLPLGTVNPYLTSATANLQQQTSITVANGYLPMSLQPQSITTFDGFYEGGPASGTYSIQNVNSGDLLDVAGASTSEGVQVIQYTANGGSNQLWNITSLSNGAYTICNINSGLYLAVSSNSTSSGADVIQWASNGSQNEQWYVRGTPAGSWILINVNSGMKLAIAGASTNINASAIQYTDNGSSAELWRIIPQ
jgi:glucuronoarabinoxylan endo-1,4-beta-xylanase